MTGPDDELLPDGVPAFGDPAYDDLRTDLAGLRATDPMPADVAARLDAVIADLSGSAAPVAASAAPVPDDQPEPAPVVPLRKRSRVGPRLLVAAAAVVVVGAGGIGLAQVVRDGSDDLKTSADSAATGATAPGAAVDSDSAAESPELDEGTPAAAARVIVLTTAGFDAEVRTLLATAVAPTASEQLPEAQDGLTRSASPLPTPGPADLEEQRNALKDLDSALLSQYATTKRADCAPVVKGATTVPVVLDGRPAVLAVFEAADGTVRVEARDCTGSVVLVSTDIPD